MINVYGKQVIWRNVLLKKLIKATAKNLKNKMKMNTFEN